MRQLQRRLTSSQIIILGFAAVILLGSLLLMLPVSAADGRGVPFGDALFTAASAVCVTGLVIRDTAACWSLFGQAVILVLIQIGGMGVVTVTLAIFAASGGRVSLKQRSTMQESISAPQVGGILRLTGFILKMTVLFELAGTTAMAPVFCGEFGLLRGLWYSLFHSVSAFCNAGFDLMGVKAPFSSLTFFPAHPVINLTVMALIVTGGIGFLVWNDIRSNGLHFRLQSKAALTVSGLLILLPALYFFLCELGDVPPAQRLWMALFQSVTTRTAGFNTVDLTAFSEAGLAVMILLMLIGGSPGSTAGGMKTTTLAVLLSTSLSVFRRRDDPRLFGRSLADETVRSAATILTMYLTLFLAGGLLISRIEGLPLLPCLFEAASAVGTVGLSLGLTPRLGPLSRGILILLMYLGRVGGLTLIFAALSAGRPTAARLPREKLTVG